MMKSGGQYHHAAIRRLLTRFLFAGGLDGNHARLCSAQGDKTPHKGRLCVRQAWGMLSYSHKTTSHNGLWLESLRVVTTLAGLCFLR
nr:hypothetical protein [Escherichia coli]